MNGDLAIWASETGEYFIIGDDDCKPGDPIVIAPIDTETIITWIKALTTMLEDGEIINLPGEMGQCTKA